MFLPEVFGGSLPAAPYLIHMAVATITISGADAREIRSQLEYDAANDQMNDPGLEAAYDALETGVLNSTEDVILKLDNAVDLCDALDYMDEAGHLDESTAATHERLGRILDRVA